MLRWIGGVRQGAATSRQTRRGPLELVEAPTRDDRATPRAPMRHVHLPRRGGHRRRSVRARPPRVTTAAGVPAISVFTSGDLVHGALRALGRGDDAPLLEGTLAVGQNRAFVFGNGDDDDAYLTTAGVEPSDVDDADFLLARGLFCTRGAWRRDLDYSPRSCDAFLEAAARRDLPMIVANPDLVRPDGKNSPMPGVLAERYADAFGGRCVLVGKPHASIYDAAFAALASVGLVDKSRIAAVGDSMHHDILGGSRSGVDTIFVAGGVHATQLGVPQGLHVPPDAARLDAFFADFPEDQRPTATIPGFTLASSQF